MLLERIAELVISSEYLSIDNLVEKLSAEFPVISRETIESEVKDFLIRVSKVQEVEVTFLVNISISSKNYYCFKWDLDEDNYIVFDIQEDDVIPNNLIIKGDNFTLINQKTRIRVLSTSKLSEDELESLVQNSTPTAVRSGKLIPKILTFKEFLDLIN